MIVLQALWWRWLALGWIGRIGSLAAALYAFGWILGNLGFNELAREFGAAALYVVAFPITALIIRGLWRRATALHRP